MLEKYLKMLFSFNLKKNINLFLIILVLLILALLFFGNFNLVEGNACKAPGANKDTPPAGDKKLQDALNKVDTINCGLAG